MSKTLEGRVAFVTGGNKEHNAAMSTDHVEGLVNYLEYTGERPVIYLYKPLPGVRFARATASSIRSGCMTDARLPTV